MGFVLSYKCMCQLIINVKRNNMRDLTIVLKLILANYFKGTLVQTLREVRPTLLFGVPR